MNGPLHSGQAATLAGGGPAGEPDVIRGIECTTARFALPVPILVGDQRISSREYTFVRLETEQGFVGKAYALSYGLPVAAIIRDSLRVGLIGEAAEQIVARWQQCYDLALAAGRTGLVLKAMSLIDVALWDVKAQRAGMPLWKLLGGFRSQVPVMMVAGYLTDEITPDELAQSLIEYAGAGNRYLKIARPPDPALTRRLLAALGDGLPSETRVVIDGVWSWSTVGGALEEVASWQPERLGQRLAWLEDPFPPENTELYRAFCANYRLAVGVGDELTDRHAFQALISRSGVRVVRIDPMAIGGITGALETLYLARSHNLEIAPHIYPEVNVHLGVALPGCTAVEMFDPAGNDLECSHQFLLGGPEVDNGWVRPPAGAGLGFDIDWEVVHAHSPSVLEGA